MLNIIGWLALLMLMLWITCIGVVAALNNLGKYNIGGANNTVIAKLITLLVLCGIGYCWYGLAKIAPFTVTLG